MTVVDIVSTVCSVMASKAYVASMTVTELKQELKQRGLSTRGSKKSLRDRLERVSATLSIEMQLAYLFCDAYFIHTLLLYLNL